MDERILMRQLMGSAQDLRTFPGQGQETRNDDGVMAYDFAIEIERISGEDQDRINTVYGALVQAMDVYDSAIASAMDVAYEAILADIDSAIEHITGSDKYVNKLNTSRTISGKFTDYVHQHRQVHRHVSALSRSTAKQTNPIIIDGHCVEQLIENEEEREGVEYLVGLSLLRLGRVDIARMFGNEMPVERLRSKPKLISAIDQFKNWDLICEKIDRAETESILGELDAISAGAQESGRPYMPACNRLFSRNKSRIHYLSLCFRGQESAALDYIRNSDCMDWKLDSEFCDSMKQLFLGQNKPILDEQVIDVFKKDMAASICVMKPENDEGLSRCFNALSVCLHAGRKVSDTVARVSSVVRQKLGRSKTKLRIFCEDVFFSTVKFPSEPVLYHSYFLCPVLRKSDGTNNAPLKLSCGHVISAVGVNTSYVARYPPPREHRICFYCQERINMEKAKYIRL